MLFSLFLAFTLRLASPAQIFAGEPAPSPAEGRVVAAFSCARPQVPDEGTDFNVSLACRLVDGRVVKRGEVFSYIECLNAATEPFKPGLSIENGRFVKSVGGGYCQVAAALYNAALLAGLPVWERYPHSLYDPGEAYVPAGLDAAVSRQARADLRFQNVLAHPITIHATKQGTTVTVEFLGESLVKPRRVTTELVARLPKKVLRRRDASLQAGQEVVDRPGYDGLEIHRTLHETDSEGNSREVDLGTDHYSMVPEIVRHGPEPSAASPRP